MTAETLRALHVPGRPLVLPNAWDADTARLVEEAGFPVVATSSVAVAAALGYPDGEKAPVEEMFAAAARIARAVSVPVTVDAEGGYRLTGAEFTQRLLATGAVGCNYEDTDHTAGGLRPVDEQAARLAVVRAAAGPDLVINARIDVFLGAPDERAALPEAIARARAYLAAGADCVYPILLRDTEVLAEFVAAVSPAAVNANGADFAALAGLGVARISLGAGLWRATRAWMAGHLKTLR
ncbi:isocitrate lyase/phosphoenolpyruvate mutase family protein [Amycolatopsis endophytica]|uniref:2-methylisocitrate lyase-like PEP mutase family enzyme n=1 Tax=Amycolatopsis endophytica TaxID=860233 RepID=A0A853B526_9PSEU|nr:isocitrate lyase/phosphoenolpyruvate mutase family protein [Amycolatopsis endophytica]NYI89915.1 2-methylisocitrate lyase-like PEP mutase family enzyme [Amycolatopsis endophytica]